MSLFNRPTFAKAQAFDSEDGGTNIFSHSNRSYRDIVADNERRKQEKLDRKRAKEERRSIERRQVTAYASEELSNKRRRISTEDDDLSHLALPRAPTIDNDDGYVGQVKGINNGAPRRSPRTNKLVQEDTGAVPFKLGNAQVVDLGGDSGDEEDFVIYTAASKQPEKANEDSDDEFAELARRARQQRQQREHDGKKSQTPDIGARAASAGANAAVTGQGNLPTPPPDPTIEILITSALPNTNPLIVRRKLSQNLGDIRKAWCGRQGFSEESMKDVFFTHRTRRVYDVTTCKSLGLEVDSFGNLILRGAEGKEDVEKVHLEAVTEELLERKKAEAARESRRRPGDAEVGAEGEQAEAAPPEQESLIRLTLKARGREDFKLKVKPTTKFSKIMSAYVKTNLTSDQAVSLEFDGERLNPEDEVQNTDIADLDCIDVHVTSG